MQDEPEFEEEIIQTGTTNGMEGLSSTAQTVIIVAISLPCLLFIYLLFKPTRMAERETANSNKTASKRQKAGNKPKISRLKHSD